MRKRPYVALGIAVALVLAAVLAVVFGSTPVRRFSADLVLGNRYHYLPCEELPSLEAVNSALADNPKMVRRIEDVHPGFVTVTIDSTTCPGKADIVILFATREDRKAIEEIIGGDTLFGVPYRMFNV